LIQNGKWENSRFFYIEKEEATEDIKAKIGHAVGPIAEKHGQELVEVVIASNSGGAVIKISVGSKKGPTVDDLTLITKEFRKYADAAGTDFIPFDYQLEISSPGIDRELREFRDFFWNEGKTLKITVKDGEKNKNLEGELVKAETDSIVILAGGAETKIPYESVIKAKVKIKF